MYGEINSISLEGLVGKSKLVSRGKFVLVEFNLLTNQAGVILCVFRFHNQKQANRFFKELQGNARVIVNGVLRNLKTHRIFVQVQHTVVVFKEFKFPKAIPTEYACTPPSCPQDIDDAWDMSD
ncbi:MAG: hypothetical protein [Bacteriophage sp.]|nr:MAG: hypothetical protein [Bacteriophage sp.]